MATNKELAAQVAQLMQAVAAMADTGKTEVKDKATVTVKFADASDLPDVAAVREARTAKRVAEAADTMAKAAQGLYGKDFAEAVAVGVARRDALPIARKVAGDQAFRTRIVKEAAGASDWTMADIAEMLRAFTPAGKPVCHLKDITGKMPATRDIRTIPDDFALMAWRGLDRRPFTATASLAAFIEALD